jgi:hypothetical protein
MADAWEPGIKITPADSITPEQMRFMQMLARQLGKELRAKGYDISAIREPDIQQVSRTDHECMDKNKEMSAGIAEENYPDPFNDVTAFMDREKPYAGVSDTELEAWQKIIERSRIEKKRCIRSELRNGSGVLVCNRVSLFPGDPARFLRASTKKGREQIFELFSLEPDWGDIQRVYAYMVTFKLKLRRKMEYDKRGIENSTPLDRYVEMGIESSRQLRMHPYTGYRAALYIYHTCMLPWCMNDKECPIRANNMRITHEKTSIAPALNYWGETNVH